MVVTPECLSTGHQVPVGGSFAVAVATMTEVGMRSDDSLVERVRGEYREMPGLSLTLSQACRLWQVDRDQCEAVLETLVAEQFLIRTKAGAFMALPAPRGNTTKVPLPESRAPRRSA